MTSLVAGRHGSRTPRVSKYPHGLSSAGPEAVELAASAGLRLDPWQQDVLSAALQERPDGKWASFEVGLIVSRQNGKGSILEARELAGLFLFGERMIVHTSHEFKTSLEAFRRIRYLVESTPDLDRKVNNYWQTTGREGIELIGGAQLRFVARSKGSGRGFSGDLVILDEAFALEDEQIEALLPTLSARPNPQLWYTSSPPLDPMSGAPLFALKARGESPEETDGLCWMDWGCPYGVDVDDRDAWASANPALGIRISEEFVARERAAMTPEGFARERLGVWPPRAEGAEWAVFNRSAWFDPCKDPESAPQDPVSFSLIVSEDLAWTSVCVGGQRADGTYHVEIAERQPGTSWAVPWMVERHATWRPCRVVINKSTPAGQFIGELEQAGIEVTTISTQDACAASNALLTAVEAGTVRHRGQGALNVSIAKAVKRPVAKTWELALTAGSTDVSPGPGCAYALWGFMTRPAPAQQFFASVRGR